MNKLSRYTVHLLVIAGILLGTAACKKNAGNPPPPPPEKKLAKILEDNGDYINFDYGTNGKVNHVTAQFDLGGNGSKQFSLHITYRPNNEIETVTTGNGLKTTYFYENGKISRLEQRDVAGGLIQKKELQYENGKLVRSTVLVPPRDGAEPEAVSEIVYSYYTNHRHDVREEVHYEINTAGQLEKAVIYKYEAYEEKINPYALLGEFGSAFFQRVSRYNAITESVYDKNYILEGTNENTYTYDADGYTIGQKQVIQRQAGPINKTVNTTYIYK